MNASTKATPATKPQARPVLDTRAKTPTLAQSAAASKGLKPTPAVLAKATAPKATTTKPAAPKKDPATAKAQADAKDEAAIAKAKADAQKAKDAAKKQKEADRAKAKADKEAAKADKEAAKAKAKKEREEARAKAKAERLARGTPDRLVPADLSHYVINKEVKTTGGHASVNCGDQTATKLMGKTIDEVYKDAATVLGEAEKDLRAKYAHLNVGMQRMNLGNRMRAAVMKVNDAKAEKKAAKK